jgi:glycosyltransferase involved in cell wall biosynthesis
MSMRLTLCLLTWNEITGCQKDVPQLELGRFEEVYAIDGGSTDGTVEYLQSQGVPVYRQEKPGYNNAYLSAFRRCGTDAVIMFHPKGTVDPKVTLEFRRYLEDGYDLVIASRIIPDGMNEEDIRILKPRKWFVMAVAVTARVLWKREGNMIWDVVHGCRAMRKDSFFAIEPLEDRISIDSEMVVRSYRKRLKRIEFAVREKPRSYGETHFKALPAGRRHLQYLLDELRRPA